MVPRVAQGVGEAEVGGLNARCRGRPDDRAEQVRHQGAACAVDLRQ